MHKMNSKLALLAATSVLVAGPSFAEDNSGDVYEKVSNLQQNWAEMRASLNSSIKKVDGDVTLTSAAIGNSLSVELDGQSELVNDQISGLDQNGAVVESADINSYLSATGEKIDGSFESTAAAIANSASVTANPRRAFATVKTEQIAYSDVAAGAAVSARRVSGNVDVTAAAINNSFNAEIDGSSVLNNRQFNFGDATAAADVDVYKTGPVAVTAAALGNSASFTIDAKKVEATELYNRQGGSAASDISSQVNLYGENIKSTTEGVPAVASTSAAIGNSLSVEASGTVQSRNFQNFNGDVYAGTETALKNVKGDVEVTTAAIANSASYEIGKSNYVNIDNKQRTEFDPTAVTTATIKSVRGDVDVTTAAMSNSLSVSTLPSTTSYIRSDQMNAAYTEAASNVAVSKVLGNVNVTSAAIGNSVNISNLPH